MHAAQDVVGMRVGHDLEQAIPFAVDQGARHDIQRRGRGLHVMAGPAGGLLRESDRGKVRGPLLPHRSNSDTRPLRLADEPLVKGTYLGVGLPGQKHRGVVRECLQSPSRSFPVWLP